MKTAAKHGWGLIKRGHLEDAKDHFLRLAERHPTDIRPLRALLVIARRRKDRQSQLEWLNRIIDVDPESLADRIALGHVLALRGKIDEFRGELGDYLERAQRGPLTQDAADMLLLAIQYGGTGRERFEHLARLRKILEMQPDSAIDEDQWQRSRLARVTLALGDYDAFAANVEALLGLGGPDTPKTEQMARVAEKCRSAGFPDFNAPKIFGIGLSRTGTSSLNTALSILGYDAIHWLNPFTRNLISREDFFLFDAFTDTPVSYQFEHLYHSFPNARFVYTSRPVESWVKSVSTHYQAHRGISHPYELNRYSARSRYDHAAGHIECNLYARYQTWQEAYAAFDQRVRLFFSDKPSSCFTELNVFQGDGWEKLCSLLERPIPEQPYPNTNASPRLTRAPGKGPEADQGS